MTCPDCGYMMTAFDKSCARCERIGKPQEAPPTLTKLPAEDEPEPLADPAEPHYANITPIPQTKSAPQSVYTLLWVIASVVVVIGVILAVASITSPPFDTASAAKQANDDCRNELNTNCDEDIKALRDHGDIEDARQAEAARDLVRFLDGKR